MEQEIGLQKNLESEPMKYYPMSFYKNVVISPTGLSSLTFSKDTNNTQMTFQIPAGNIYNFFRSYLSFNMSDIISGAANQNCNLFNDHIPFFSKLELFTSNNNTYLINVSNLNVVNKMLSSLELNYRERNKSLDSHMYKSYRGFAQNIDSAAAFITPAGPLDKKYSIESDTSLYTVCPNNAGVYSESDLDKVGCIDSHSYYLNGVTAAINTISIKGSTYNIQLRDLLPNSSFLSIDKDIYSANTIFVRLTFTPVNYWGFGKNTAVADKNDNLGNTATYITMNTFLGANTITLSNIKLNMFNQANPVLCQMIQEKSNQQEELFISMIQTQQMDRTGSSQGVSFKVVSINPKSRILKSYHSCFAPNALTDLNLIRINDNANPGTEANALLAPIYKYKSCTLKLDGNIYLVFDINNNDFYRYICQNWDDHSYTSLFDYCANPVIAFNYDSKKSKIDKYSPYEERGLELRNSEIMIQHDISGVTSTVTLTHYDVVNVLTPIYMKGGIISLNPFV